MTKFPSLKKFIPYVQEMLALTQNMEDELDAVAGVEISVFSIEIDDWVNLHYDGEKFVIYNKDETEREEVFCRRYE